MLLKSDMAAREHRQRKRTAEIEKILAEVRRTRPACEGVTERILEFGCGNGFQIPYLRQLGDVTATDIYTSREIREIGKGRFLESDITALPFRAKTFSMIFSNHVIEHLPDPGSAFRELKRVGTDNCLYIFSVPTNCWLLLSLPQKYLGKCAELLGLMRKSAGRSAPAKNVTGADTERRLEMETRFGLNTTDHRSLLQLCLPKGHGVYPEFMKCYRAFRPANWNRFFLSHGFNVKKVVPLLLYGPSERPVIPTTDKLCDFGICSSVLFILNDKI